MPFKLKGNNYIIHQLEGIVSEFDNANKVAHTNYVQYMTIQIWYLVFFEFVSRDRNFLIIILKKGFYQDEGRRLKLGTGV